jgi:hypothetical protein
LFVGSALKFIYNISYDVAQLATTIVNAVEAEKFFISVIMVPVRLMEYVPASKSLLVSIVSFPVVNGGPVWFN